MKATNNEETTDTLWEEMKSLAVEQQQCFYEILSDCIQYKFHERKYLELNIGYAIFGLPKSNENTNSTESNNCYWKSEDANNTDADIADMIDYDKKAKNVIDTICEKIYKYTRESNDTDNTNNTNNTESIYFDIIYNIIFRPKMNVKSKKKEVKEETEVKKKKEEEEECLISSIPIFKFRRNIHKISNIAKSAKQKENTKNEDETDYETWYIDISGRVYKNWADYINNNNLPKCTMVLPKDGFYQADESYPVGEDYSTVWLEIIESPACSWTTVIRDGIDITSSVVAFGTAGLSAVSLFTPVAPVTLTAGLVAGSASSVWTIVRSSQNLADRSNHEESIWDKDALPHWFSLTSSTFGFGAFGGSAALSKAAANGTKIPNVAKIAFNTVQSGNLIFNGAGIIYQGYNMINKYKTDKTVDKIDVLNLAINVMFFTGAVIKIQFANDIIKSAQSKVINDYKDTLRKRNLRKKFNRVARKAANNNTCKIFENAEVIKYIKNREQMLSATQSTNKPVTHGKTLNETLHNRVWSYNQGKLIVNGIIILLDPIEFVLRLINSDLFNENYQNNQFGSQNYDDDSFAELKNVFSNLLNNFYKSKTSKSMNVPLFSDFEPLIKDMSSMKINAESLKKLFKIVERLMKRCKDKEDFLLIAFNLIWQYCTTNLKQWNICTYNRMRSMSGSIILQKIIIVVYEAIDLILDKLFKAFEEYIYAKLHK